MKYILKASLFSLLLVSLTQGQENASAPSLDQRLEHLVNKLETKHIEYHIPGMQLAVVVDDEVVLVHSFGESNTELALPVTNKTLFAIGSVTKSFTATAIAVLVDEGKMRWDAPITEYLPAFILPIEINEDDPERTEVLLRDLLSHQTGFTRMQFLGINNSLSRKEMLKTAILAKPVAPIHTLFLYNNEQYLASGYAAGKVAGSDWNTLIEERLFTPLGMNDTFSSWRRAGNEYTISAGHVWDEEEKEYKLYPLRTIDNIGPAGSIVSTATDMANWVRFNLGHGEFLKTQIISSPQHAELWKQQIEISPGIGYGFGWVLHENGGMQIVEHGGSVRGGCAKVAMFPTENIGFVLLMNVTNSPLVEESVSIVRESLLGEITEANIDSSELAPYVGTYVGNFASFDNAIFTVQNKDGTLALDVPDQMLYELKSPGEDGKWYFAMTDQVAVSFDRDDDGNVVGLKMYQAGMTFELPREGVEIAVEIPLEELKRYLGKFHSDELDESTTVVIQNNRLAIDVPNQMVFEFNPPNEDGEWVCRLTDKLRVRFIEDDNELVTGFEFIEGTTNFRMFQRVVISDDIASKNNGSDLDSFGLEKRQTALDALGCVSFEGTVKMEQSGISGKVSLLIDPKKRFLSIMDCGKYGWFRYGSIGDEGLMDVAFAESEELDEVQIEHFHDSSVLAWVGDWRKEFSTIEFQKEEVSNGRKVWIYTLQEENDPTRKIAIDQLTGDVVFVQSKQPIPEFGIALPYKLNYRDFKEVRGVRIPMVAEERNDLVGALILTLQSFETNIEANDDIFRIVPRKRLLPWIAGAEQE
ncbi:MAG TPA: serine hydrolase [Phycisphaerales bacterium]|nr:serine hydrolase [Phycisphaerales bacterium]